MTLRAVPLTLLAAGLLLAACRPAEPAPVLAASSGEAVPTAVTPPTVLIPTRLPTPPRTDAPQVQHPATITLIAVGDVMLGRQVNISSLRRDDFLWPFRETANILAGADLTIGNLESPLIEDCRLNDSAPVFCGDARAVDGLAFAGFDVLSLANNHSRDMGVEGFAETAAALTGARIAPVYDDEVFMREINGVRVGVIGIDDTDEALSLPDLTADAAQAAAGVDVLVGILHWGREYSPPTPRQQEAARALIDAGVDAIIGSHPHVVQAVEEYNGAPIFYSLGNFVFDQMWSEATREGYIARIQIEVHSGAVTITHEMIPVKIYFYGQPRADQP
ncbi:MAG: capsular polyglutamate synthetase PgsA [Anaerolineae bacterium]